MSSFACLQSLDCEREQTYRKGLQVANWAQIQKQSLAAISTKSPLLQTALQEKPALNCLPALCFCPSEPALVKEFLEHYFSQRDEEFPV